ncbi:MAG: PTS glucose transporter subunit IIA [Aerococcus sp.]|nr:PTS glucose transporter subunit IIA [Aerococcus sp.]
MGFFDFLKKEETPRQKTIALRSPLAGKIVPLEDVPDQVFAGEMMGKGIAIQPEMREQTVLSPVSGKIVSVFPTKHAVTIRTAEGLELLIHLGLDTVELEGKGFEALIQDGDTVKVGDELMMVDFPAIDQEGYATVTPLVITNGSDTLHLDQVASGEVKAGEELLMMTIKE